MVAVLNQKSSRTGTIFVYFQSIWLRKAKSLIFLMAQNHSTHEYNGFSLIESQLSRAEAGREMDQVLVIIMYMTKDDPSSDLSSGSAGPVTCCAEDLSSKLYNLQLKGKDHYRSEVWCRGDWGWSRPRPVEGAGSGDRRP